MAEALLEIPELIEEFSELGEFSLGGSWLDGSSGWSTLDSSELSSNWYSLGNAPKTNYSFRPTGSSQPFGGNVVEQGYDDIPSLPSSSSSSSMSLNQMYALRYPTRELTNPYTAAWVNGLENSSVLSSENVSSSLPTESEVSSEMTGAPLQNMGNGPKTDYGRIATGIGIAGMMLGPVGTVIASAITPSLKEAQQEKFMAFAEQQAVASGLPPWAAFQQPNTSVMNLGGQNSESVIHVSGMNPNFLKYGTGNNVM